MEKEGITELAGGVIEHQSDRHSVLRLEVGGHRLKGLVHTEGIGV